MWVVRLLEALLKRWLGDNPVSDAASSLSELLKGRLSDRLAQQRARHQFEAIGEKVGESLLPLFEMEGAGLDEGSRTAVALAVADTLNTATSTLLAQHDLEPIEIARQLLQDRPASACHFSDAEGRLYERTVGESCQYIVDIATQLPHFTERTLAEVLTRERQLLEIAERVVQEVTRLRAELTPQIETARFELDYRRAVVRILDELELFGSGMSLTSRKYSLDLAYVALSLERQVLRRQSARKRRFGLSPDEKDEQPQMVHLITDISAVLEESSYLLLRGDAGSGKTTLMQWIAVRSASRSFPPKLALWNEAVPFFIRLRQHIRAADEGSARWPAPETFPALIAPAIAGAMPHGWVHRQLQDGRAIVLIDGVDEVPEELRREVYTWLGDLLAAYPRARFIVTSRPYAAHKDDLPAGERLKEARVLPLDLSTIELFVQQWHRAVAANLQDTHEQQALYEAARRLIAGIRASSVQQQLVTNPLLCAMLCTLHRERHQRLPASRVALYEACCELLIERRDQERHISLADYPAAVLSYEQKRLLLADLAYWLVRNGQTEVSAEVVDERLTRRLGGMVGASRDLQGRGARLLFVERCGVLREPARGVIDFAHRSLQEFLAARAVVDENDIPLLVQHAHDDMWREVVLLTAGLASRTVRENLVERLLKRGEMRKRFRLRLYSLAAACTQAAPEEMKVEIQSCVRQDLGKLVPLRGVEEVEALALAGPLAIPFLAPRFAYSPQVAAACVRVLIQLGSEEALNALQAYVTDGTSDVVDALLPGLRDARDKPVYAQRFLSHVRSITGTSALLPLLPFLPDLTTLSLFELPAGTDLSVLAQLARLTNLTLSRLPAGMDLSALAHLAGLTDLTLSRLSVGTDLSVLVHLAGLTSLRLSELPAGTDLSVLAHLMGL
ncbi:MAG TPA: NACHT domain-containing protein, partial [Ktedonobacteraceae bacterium]